MDPSPENNRAAWYQGPMKLEVVKCCVVCLGPQKTTTSFPGLYSFSWGKSPGNEAGQANHDWRIIASKHSMEICACNDVTEEILTFKVSTTLRDRLQVDRSSFCCFYEKPYKLNIFWQLNNSRKWLFIQKVVEVKHVGKMGGFFNTYMSSFFID